MIASIAPEEVRHRFHHGDTGREKKIVAPASRRHLSLDNSFWVNTTFAGWKPAIHFFSRPQRARRLHRGFVHLRVLRVSVVNEVLEFVLSSAFRNTSGDRSEKAQAPTGLIEAGLS